ncbi:hypothetical protein Tco_1073242 [Tanacetum coccineum]
MKQELGQVGSKNDEMLSWKKLCPQSLGRNLCCGCRVGEKVRVFLLHLVFTLPGELRTPLRVPVYFDYRNATLLQTLDLTVYDLDRFSSYVDIALLTITGRLDTALDLNNFLGCLVDDLWASELTISNFSPPDRKRGYFLVMEELKRREEGEMVGGEGDTVNGCCVIMI